MVNQCRLEKLGISSCCNTMIFPRYTCTLPEKSSQERQVASVRCKRVAP